jgi:type V secretory pathway adhesin AidA
MEVKEAPVRGVRAVVGRLFGGRSKARAKADKVTVNAPESSHVKVIDTDAPQTEAPAAEAVATAAAPETVVPEAAAPETANPEAEASAPATPEAEAPAPQTAAPETVSPDAKAPVAEETAAPEAAEAADVVLPLANYDTLTVASLRARLRTLSIDDLVVLISYEKSHEGREEVVGMFERRKAKIIAGETSSFQAVK